MSYVVCLSCTGSVDLSVGILRPIVGKSQWRQQKMVDRAAGGKCANNYKDNVAIMTKVEQNMLDSNTKKAIKGPVIPTWILEPLTNT